MVDGQLSVYHRNSLWYSSRGLSEHRTSEGIFLDGESDEALAWLEDKVARVTGIPASHGEVGRPLLCHLHDAMMQGAVLFEDWCTARAPQLLQCHG